MPNIDVSTIEGFDAMTPEQKVEALLKVEIPEKIDMAQYVSKETSNKLASENKALKDQLKSKMTEDEAAAAERETKWAEMEAKLAALEKEKLESTYKSQYLALGYEAKLAEDTAKALVEGDMKKFFENQQKAAEAVVKRLKDELTRQDPRPGGAGGGEQTEKTKAVQIAEKIGKDRSATAAAANDILSKYIGGK